MKKERKKETKKIIRVSVVMDGSRGMKKSIGRLRGRF